MREVRDRRGGGKTREGVRQITKINDFLREKERTESKVAEELPACPPGKWCHMHRTTTSGRKGGKEEA